jgi:hypothetical protein
MNENLIPFPKTQTALEIVIEITSMNSKQESLEILNQKLSTFNRFLDIHGYTADDLKKVKMMKEAYSIIESQ